jgi:hypothetical protein
MSYIGLLLQTKLLATWTREGYTSVNAFGEQVTTEETIHENIPCRKQHMRDEQLIEAGIPTDMGTIKWLLWLPIEWPTGTPIDIRSGDILRVQDTRMQNAMTYFKVVMPENAVEEQHHFEVILIEYSSHENT